MQAQAERKEDDYVRDAGAFTSQSHGKRESNVERPVRQRAKEYGK